MTDEVRTAPKDVHVDEVRDLVARGKEKGWLTADEIADALGALDLSAEQVDNVYALVAEEGIEVVDHEPGADTEDVEDFRRDPDLLKAPTNDPVRMYLKEIGKVPLLTAAQEVQIGRRIEVGQIALRRTLVGIPMAVEAFLAVGDKLRRGEMPADDVIVLPEGGEIEAKAIRPVVLAFERIRRLERKIARLEASLGARRRSVPTTTRRTSVQASWTPCPDPRSRPRPRCANGYEPGPTTAGHSWPTSPSATTASSPTSTGTCPTAPPCPCSACATAAPPTAGALRSTSPAAMATKTLSYQADPQSAPPKKPSTAPAASTSTTPPPGPNPRRTNGRDH